MNGKLSRTHSNVVVDWFAVPTTFPSTLTQLPILVTPGTVSSAKTVFTGAAMKSAVAGVPAAFNLQLRDAYGNNVNYDNGAAVFGDMANTHAGLTAVVSSLVGKPSLSQGAAGFSFLFKNGTGFMPMSSTGAASFASPNAARLSSSGGNMKATMPSVSTVELPAVAWTANADGTAL